MKQLRDEAYVLGTYQLGEADLIVTLLAEREGRVRGVARGARRSRRRFGGALEPLTRVRASWSEREGRELHRIDSLEPLKSYAPMQSDPVRQAACGVLSEIASVTVREGQGDPRLFRLLGAVLDALEEGMAPLAAVRYFELWTLRLHGVLPELDYCAGCASELGSRDTSWACAEQGLLCASCRIAATARTRPLEPRDRSFLRAALANPPGALGGEAGAARGGALDLLLRGALRGFVERPLRTYRHLDTAILAADEGAPS